MTINPIPNVFFFLLVVIYLRVIDPFLNGLGWIGVPLSIACILCLLVVQQALVKLSIEE